jgi:hypothetical protein
MTTNSREVHLDELSEEELVRLLKEIPPLSRHALLEEARAKLCRISFPAFNRYFQGWQWEPYHYQWWDIIRSHKKACIIAPPEVGKTRFFTSFVAWMVGRIPDSAWLVVQNTSGQAQRIVAQIGHMLSDPRFQKIFPEIKPTERWSGLQLYVDRSGYPRQFRHDPTVAAYGIVPGTYQGAHVDGIILDDPTNQEDVLSPVVMQSQKNLLKGTLWDRLNEGEQAGYFYVVMTRWGDDDLLSTIEQDLKIPVFTFPARRPKSDPYPWGHLLSSRYTDEFLNQQKEIKGDLFQLSYMCTTVGTTAGERVFPELRMRRLWYRSLQDPDLEGLNEATVKRRAVGVDWGTSSRHESAVVYVELLSNEQVVVREAWSSSKGDAEELKAVLFSLRQRYGVRNLYLDRSQWSLKSQLESIGYDVWKGESSVELRIGALKTLISGRRVLFDRTGDGMEKLYAALEGYSRNENGRVIERNDDLVDACLYALFALVGDKRVVGLGPRVEIVSPDANDQPMVDAYHDNFDPEVYSLEKPKRTLREYSNLV